MGTVIRTQGLPRTTATTSPVTVKVSPSSVTVSEKVQVMAPSGIGLPWYR